ncbi:MAG: trigger factor [Clostridia bacterium]|jgi:trigger factor|nr:trigger factor [Clostridia bacterium]
MKANVEKIETNQMMLEVEVDSQELEKAANQAYRRLVHKYNIPGFRKGKVPRSVFEKYVGTEFLYQEAADGLLPSAYSNAVKETAIEPIDQPELEIVQLEAGKPFIFKAKVTVMPEVSLGEYKGLEVEKQVVDITDEQVDNYLKSLQERHAQLVTLEEGQVENEDIAIIDFEGFLEEEAFEGGKGEDHPLGIGSNTFIPGFEEQLIGLAVGEEKDVRVTFPDDYHAEELAGKEAIFKVKVKGIRRKQLAPLDDEFAKDVSEFDTLEELKADAREKLEQNAKARAEAAVREQVVDQAAANAQVEIPQVLIERQIDYMLGELNYSLQMQGLGLEQYMQFMGKNEDELIDEFRERAHKTVLSELTLEAIAKTENIEATDEDVNEELQKIADRYQQDIEEVRQNITMNNRLEDLKHSIALDKTVEFLVEAAQIKEVAGDEK